MNCEGISDVTFILLARHDAFLGQIGECIHIDLFMCIWNDER